MTIQELVNKMREKLELNTKLLTVKAFIFHICYMEGAPVNDVRAIYELNILKNYNLFNKLQYVRLNQDPGGHDYYFLFSDITQEEFTNLAATVAPLDSALYTSHMVERYKNKYLEIKKDADDLAEDCFLRISHENISLVHGLSSGQYHVLDYEHVATIPIETDVELKDK